MTSLRNEGLPCEEFPQSIGNLTRAGQALFDLLNGRNLVLYPAVDLRQQALSTVSVETPRGFRIAKEKASKKIDAIVALSMAAVAALDAGNVAAAGVPDAELETLVGTAPRDELEPESQPYELRRIWGGRLRRVYW